MDFTALHRALGESQAQSPRSYSRPSPFAWRRRLHSTGTAPKINYLFSGEDFTPVEEPSWVEGLVTVLPVTRPEIAQEPLAQAA